jgi:hypothetical protein
VGPATADSHYGRSATDDDFRARQSQHFQREFEHRRHPAPAAVGAYEAVSLFQGIYPDGLKVVQQAFGG